MRLQLKMSDAFGFALGLFATLSQVVLMRESLGLSGGNELTVGLGFTAWLLCVGAGALSAGAFKRPFISLIVGGVIAPFAVGGCSLALRLHREILNLPPGGAPSLASLSALLLFSLGVGGFSIGFLFTAAARAASEKEKTPVSRLYTAESFGSLAGGLIFTFLLSGRIPHLVAIAIAGVALFLGIAFLKRGLAATSLSSVLGIALLAVIVSGVLTKLDKRAEVRAFNTTLAASEFIAATDSAYGRLTLGSSEDQYVLLIDGHIDHAFPDPWERPIPVHMALSQHPNPKSILIIGGGPTDILTAALAHNPDQVVMTYLDIGVTNLCKPFWSEDTKEALVDPRVTVINDDGRHYVSVTNKKFDVVLVALEPPLSSQANRYHTLEFFKAVKNILNLGGTLTVLAPGGATIMAPEAARAAAAELATLKAVFQHVIAVPGIKTIFHAALKPGIITGDSEILEKRYESRGVKTKHFSAHRFMDILDAVRMKETARDLARQPSMINTDSKPVVFLAALQLWERGLKKSRSVSDVTFTGLLERFAWLWLALPLGIWFLWQWFYIGKNRSRGASVSIFAIGTTGAAGMAGEIVVLYTFQAASGQLYRGLAFLIALFMAGLAVGAYFGRKKLSLGSLRQSIFADGLVLAFLLLSGPVLTFALNYPLLVTGWSFIAGVVTGTAFPAFLGRAAKKKQGDERRVAAAIEAADHIGAAFGALVTGVVWLPVFGISFTFLLFSCFKVISISALLISRKTC